MYNETLKTNNHLLCVGGLRESERGRKLRAENISNLLVGVGAALTDGISQLPLFGIITRGEADTDEDICPRFFI